MLSTWESQAMFYSWYCERKGDYVPHSYKVYRIESTHPLVPTSSILFGLNWNKQNKISQKVNFN